MAFLKGSDPSLAASTVVLSAHLDHTGVRPSGEGRPDQQRRLRQRDRQRDSPRSGARARRAAGAAEALDPGRARDRRGEGPARVRLLRPPPGEGRGTDGRQRQPRHARLPGGERPTSSRSGPRTRRSTRSCGTAAAGVGYTLSPDPMPDENIFVRSDQYSFVKKGVPAVYLMPGWTAADPGVNGAKVFEGFLASHYHQPSDDLSLPMDLRGRRALHAPQPRDRARHRRRVGRADVEAGQLLRQDLRRHPVTGVTGREPPDVAPAGRRPRRRWPTVPSPLTFDRPRHRVGSSLCREIAGARW